MKRARDLSEFAELVRQAMTRERHVQPYLDPLDKMLRELDKSPITDRYSGAGEGHDLPFMPLFIHHERNIPFREILRTLNAMHREGFYPDSGSH